MLTAEQQQQLAGLLDVWTAGGAGRMFICKARKSKTAIKKLRNIHRRLQKVVDEIGRRKLGGAIARPSYALYEALVYKFGVSNRHQKFWRNSLQIYRELKRLNKQDILDPFMKFLQRLEQSKFVYPPTKRAVRFLGTILLRRIFYLDKLRLICAHSADCSMGYIELRHVLTFNLMSIAIASDVASEALRQMQQLAIVYAELGHWFHQSSPRLPASVDVLKFKTNQLLDRDGRKEVKRLKKHDLTLLRKEIEGIGQCGPSDVQDFPDNLPNTIMDLALQHINDGSGQKSLLRVKRKSRKRIV